MRWKDLTTWEACIDAATRLHDGVFSSQSPLPAPRLVGCSDPEAQCVKLGVAAKTSDGSWMCTKPAFVPTLQPTDCDRRKPDWKEGGSPARSHPDSKSPSIRAGTTSDILSWVERTLDSIMSTSGDVGIRLCAGMLLHDQDLSVSIDVLQRTGEAMLVRLQFERPWEKKSA